MNLFTLTHVLVVAFVVMVLAEAKREAGKVSRYRAVPYQKEDVKDAGDREDQLIDSGKKTDSSNGRLFLRRFFFQKIFGQNQSPPIIPIIITGGNSNDDNNNTDDSPITTPTDTLTNTPTNTATNTDTNTNTNTNTATGTVTNTPPEDPTAGGNGGAAGAPTGRIQFYGRDSNEQNDDDDEVNDEDAAAAVDESSMATGLADGDGEYVITDQQIKSISNGKAYRAPVRLNLRLPGAKRGQVISIRLPAKYRGYFNNGQRITVQVYRRKRPIKRRVNRRRTNRRRNNRNRNRRRRIVAA